MDPTFAVADGLRDSTRLPCPPAMPTSAVPMMERSTSRARAKTLCASASSPLLQLMLVALTLLLAGPARADVAVMVPPHAEQMASSELLDQAMEELTRLLKLQAFDVISAGQAGAAAEAEQQRGIFPRNYDPLYCLTPECALEYRKLFDATFAVQLMIAVRAQRAASVTVVLTESPKAYFDGVAPVEGRDIRSAVRAAFESAREKQEEGAGPWLTVSGTPEGAMVYVDGAEYGKLPFTKRHIESGVHKFEVRHDDYMVESRTLNIAGKFDHVELVHVALKPLDEPQAHGSAGHRRRHVQRSPWDWALGSAVAAAGAVHLGAGIYQKRKAGDCAERASDGVCTESYASSHGTRENLLIGLGAAGVAAGALVVGLGPIGHLQVRAGADHALLQLKGRF
jgi:hypothetical protein